ncbi:hypothetical protein V6O07_00225, partial [Arthrospira platensis SPKY2]
MQRQNPAVLALMSVSSIMISAFVLSVDVARSQSNPVEVSPAEVERLQNELRLQEAVQAEANQIFSRTMALFNLLLLLLALLLAAAIAALW